ncbi:hypothetical protein MPTK1_1g13310 [Marchantia polymorpha subsp. ruderalis]|uniref:Amino acid transporter n=2 Tax=Marchantia polymorpha TaxID=3197 RepID=A0A176VL98_MARPO|nr:hypothetical protein AXG93_154s1890 [Marchantia polymorpha subsp. ruderalis]PTQ44683.1 hypothetical protein MARPO_0019s0101 [Marchantia polymorpha]BBM98413.1 hypothetical protein Mp_1g13310 [Marchantia polymorpha subsp. ruderalis]|eukprot:PTQ44683.1 hypothetical protein MARPO_0019s0101 [Marchantia polymorpha]
MARDSAAASPGMGPGNFERGICVVESSAEVAVSAPLPSRESGMLENAPHVPSGATVYYSPLPAGGKERTVFQKWKDNWLRMDLLIFWTLLGVGVGIAVGLGLYRANVSTVVIDLIGYPGELMIRALQELILPLIVFALMTGVLNLRHNSGGIARIIRWSLSYYILSMLLAVGVGIALVELIRPGNETTFSSTVDGAHSCGGKNTTTDGVSKSDRTVLESLLNIGRDVIPTNIVSAAAEANFLGIIMFSVVFASALSTLGEEAEPFIRFIEISNKVILKIILAVIAFTPVGVASLIASTILNACNLGGLLKALGLYVGTVLAGFFVHSLVVLPTTLIILSGQNPVKAFRAFFPALVMGVGTASSAATMPVTMKNAEDHGCAPGIVQFVIPLGTNINRDGAALYEAVTVIFILQAHGVSMTAGNILVVIITATLAAIGAASVPNSALVTMITVLQALGYPEYIEDVAVLYAVDWFLGMTRTAVNIWGDACAVVVVDNWNKRYEKKHDRISSFSTRQANEDLRTVRTEE